MPEPRNPADQRSDQALAAYLDALVTALDLPSGDRADVREEVAAHIADAGAELRGAGLTDDAARDEAIRRLGPPDVLGREMTRARQTRRALLAAVGGATWAGAGAAFRGLIVGWGVIAVITMAGLVGVAVVTRLTGSEPLSFGDPAWFTALQAVGLGFAAWYGARAVVSVLAQRSHRRAESLRPWVALIGGLLVGWAALFLFESAQNLSSVLALAVVPVIFVVAARTGSDRSIEPSRTAQRARVALVAALVVSVPLLGLLMAATTTQPQLSEVGGPFASMEDLLHSQNRDMPGRYVPDKPELGTQRMSLDHGIAGVELENATAVTARWRELRLEAWRSLPRGSGLDPVYQVPFVTAPMMLQADQLVGSVRVDRSRIASSWELFVTGIAADGGRDVIAEFGGSNSNFSGSAWDWLSAP